MALDFSMDEAAAAKLSLGLGDSHTPGFSLFTMPMVDIKEIPHEVCIVCFCTKGTYAVCLAMIQHCRLMLGPGTSLFCIA